MTCPVIVGISGPALGPGERRMLRRLRPCGVILFRRNLESPEQVFSLCRDVRGELGPRAPIAIDQEGGRVDRLRVLAPPSPRASLLGRLGPRACRGAGRLTGELLRALGINWDLAPCVDLGLHRYEVSGIGDRSFHRDHREVARLAGAWLEGLESAGVRGCLKHFPGHGRARVDSHVDLPVIATARRWLHRDLHPYVALAATHRPVMVAHAAYPALDPSGLPATLSRAIVTGLLREELHAGGIAVADDLEMGALRRRFGIAESARRALAAGNDAVLVCNSPDAVEEALQATRGAAGPRLSAFLRTMPPVPRRFDGALVSRLSARLGRLGGGSRA